jgi:hypothetical protein
MKCWVFGRYVDWVDFVVLMELKFNIKIVMIKDKKPLYRKVADARYSHHNKGSEAKYDRNTKEGVSKNLKKDVRRGLDYTPLYKFLLSKVGQDFDIVYSEVVGRVDNKDAIYNIIRKNEFEKGEYVTCGESSYFSKLYIDDNNLLQKINPDLKNEDFTPSCPCCTHTFNGVVLVKKFK